MVTHTLCLYLLTLLVLLMVCKVTLETIAKWKKKCWKNNALFQEQKGSSHRWNSKLYELFLSLYRCSLFLSNRIWKIALPWKYVYLHSVFGIQSHIYFYKIADALFMWTLSPLLLKSISLHTDCALYTVSA